MLDPIVLKFAGALLGVFLRTFLPARRKMKLAKREGDAWVWRRVYLKTAAISFLVAFVSSFLVLPSMSVTATDDLMIFGSSMTVGIGSNSLSNEVYEWMFGGNQNEDSGPA